MVIAIVAAVSTAEKSTPGVEPLVIEKKVSHFNVVSPTSSYEEILTVSLLNISPIGGSTAVGDLPAVETAATAGTG